MFQRLIIFLKHPITCVVITAIIAIIFYLLAEKTVEPRYSMTQPELVAEVTEEAPKLKLLWNGSEIQNVYDVKILIWNAGRQYIDNQTISSTAPIKVICPNDSQILYHKFIKTSRESLTFEVLPFKNDSENSLHIKIVGDEALEKFDGGVLKILYVGSRDMKFSVKGRIKGSKTGFKRIDWGDVVPTKITDAWLLFAMGIIFLGLGFAPTVRTIKEIKHGDSKLKKEWPAFVFFPFLAAIGALILYYAGRIIYVRVPWAG